MRATISLKHRAAIIGLTLATAQILPAALPMEDAITNAAPGANVGSVAPWGNSASQVKVASGNLTNSALKLPETAGNLASIAGTSGGSSYRPFDTSSVSSGNVYYSFLLQCTALSTGSGYLTGLLPSGITSPNGSSDALALYFNPSGNGYQLGIRKTGASAVYAGSVLATNVTQFIVVKYAFSPGTGDDTVSLFINPTPGGSEPAAPDASQTGGTDAINLQNLYLKSSAGYGTWNFDTLRVGTTWADVTPAAGEAGDPGPRITEAAASPDGIVLRGTNGTTSGVYQVLSSTNVAAPPAQWPAIATNHFDANGNFACTNPLLLSEPQRFYRLLLGNVVTPPPAAPSILGQPTNLTAMAGANGAFSVQADGTPPLTYQWFFNTNSPLAGGTNATLTLTNLQSADAGSYSVRVANSGGAVTSAVAVLTVLSPPLITGQPADQSAAVSNDATFTVTATGTAPLAYQWYFNTNTLLAGGTNTQFTVVSAQTNDAGTYTVVVTNAFGAVTSSPATLTVYGALTNPPDFSLFGFAQATTGGGVIAETDPAYVKVSTPLEFANAVRSANKVAGSVRVIEILNDLDLGWNEIGPDVQSLDSNPFRPHNTPQLHPRLLVTGVSVVDIKSKSGLTLFSANGATLRHATLNFKDTANIIVRNLKFDEMWEWDEASKGDYDVNDWDFIDIGNGGGTVSNVWIDHCTFTKAYDGICDLKGGCYNITFSWNKYVGDDGLTNTNSFVRQQINALETNPAAHPMYNFLRTHGFSVADIVTILQGHDKTHLIGATSLAAVNAQHAVTFHHQWYMSPWDRLPRLRAGNVHNYNLYVDDTAGLAARRLRDQRAAALSSADLNTLNNTYNFQVYLNGSISTENGALLVEKSVYRDCLWPLRNNQTDPSDPTYTGKIEARDTLYHFDNADGSTTDVRGNSTDPGNPLGPFQAAIIPFSWNLPGNQLPYPYVMDDPAELETIVTDPHYGAGAGVLTWAKTNWLKTFY